MGHAEDSGPLVINDQAQNLSHAFSCMCEVVQNQTMASQEVNLVEDAATLKNARALGTAMAVVVCLPWFITFLFYGLLHFTYPNDRRKQNFDDVPTPTIRMPSNRRAMRAKSKYCISIV